MKNQLKLFCCLSMVIASCQSNDIEDLSPKDFDNPNKIEFTGIAQDIVANVLTTHFNGYRKNMDNTRSMNDFSLSPYIVNGDTLLYIVQYKEGWEIYSASYATNMMPFSSDEGTFEIDDPNMPDQLKNIISNNASAIGEIQKQENDYIDPSWGWIALTEETLKQGMISALNQDNSRTQVSSESLPPGHWVLIDSEIIDSQSYISPKLTITKWGQNYPWNQYAKWINNPQTNTLKQGYAGCYAVAIGQYQYFTNIKDGVPSFYIAGAIPTRDKLDYSFYGTNSGNSWRKMAKASTDENTNSVALLLGHLGRELNGDFQLNGTDITNENALKYMNSSYQKNFSIINFNYTNTYKSIDNGYPLLAVSYANTDRYGNPITTVGHAFLIDQYRHKTTTYKYTLGLVRDPLPPGTVDKWISDLKDENGNIIVYAYTNIVTNVSISDRRISMNWGWDGAYNNIWYSPNGDWNAGNYNFIVDPVIFVEKN